MSESLTKLRETISAERDAGDPPDGDFSGEVAAYAATDAALAAVEQEMAELRKRPTLEEVTQTLDDWADDVHDERQSAEQVIVDLYAEKATTP